MIITIQQLTAQTILGIYPSELNTMRDVVMDITLYIDETAILTSHDLNDSLDYASISQHLTQWLKTKRTGLLEVLAQEILDQLPPHPYLQKAELTLHKPACVPNAVAVSVTQCRIFPSHLQKNHL